MGTFSNWSKHRSQLEGLTDIGFSTLNPLTNESTESQTEFGKFHKSRQQAESIKKFDYLALAIIDSGKTYQEWWETVGLPVLLELRCSNDDEYVEKVLLEGWMDGITGMFGGKKPQADPNAAYQQGAQARLEKIKPQIDQVKQLFIKSLEGVKQQLLQTVSKSPNQKLMFSLVNVILSNAVQSAQAFTPKMASSPEEAKKHSQQWNQELGNHQASAANAGITNAIRNAAQNPQQLKNIPPEKISQALQNDKDGSLRQTLTQAAQRARQTGNMESYKFIMNAMTMGQKNKAAATANVASNQATQQQGQEKQAFIQQVQQKRQQRAQQSGTIPVALSPQQLDAMWQDHLAKKGGGAAQGQAIPFPRKQPSVVPANTGTAPMESTQSEDEMFAESLINQSKRKHNFGILGL
jgi:hypothetical protein